ncbi:MAG: methyltransferase [Halioglobus sp.]
MKTALADTFERLDTLLSEHRQWWQFQPFHTRNSRWESQAPTLHKRLMQLSPDQLAWLTVDAQQRRDFLQHWLPVVDELEQLCQLPQLQGRTIAHDAHLEHGIGGRKWAQVIAFAALVPAQQPIVEWCSGKGHLGRVLAANGATQVNSLEREAALCRSGEALANRAGVAMTFHQRDVLRDALDGLLRADSHCVALHACGELHMHLLQQVVAHRGLAISVAPCCYYLLPQDSYTPMSTAAQRSELRLSKSDLHIPLRETVTGGARARRWRSQELRWRLAFDCLQRELRQQDVYLPLPTIARHLLGGSFVDFIHWALRNRGLPAQRIRQPDKYLQQAEARLPAIQQMELVQQVFQRPLELWLALDRALYLQDNGYCVSVGEFCARQLTPRNILIQATRRHAA